MKTLDEREFYTALAKIRDVRRWAVRTNADPFAIRQALLFAIAIDTDAALERGIPAEDLRAFDAIAIAEAQKFIQEMRRREA